MKTAKSTLQKQRDDKKHEMRVCTQDEWTALIYLLPVMSSWNVELLSDVCEMERVKKKLKNWRIGFQEVQRSHLSVGFFKNRLHNSYKMKQKEKEDPCWTNLYEVIFLD